MNTAVVILNWNGKALLEKFLPSVVDFSGNANVYVADNNSSDDSVAFVKANFPSVKIIRNAENGGYAKGYNDALSGLKEDVFVLLNSDVEVTPNWLTPLLSHLKHHPETAILQPKLLDQKNKDTFEYSGAAGGFVDKFAYPFCRGRLFATVEKDQGQYDDQCPILWASGACLVIRRSVFEKVGGMDETYFAHQEEIDLCWRAHQLGYRARYIPESTVYHMGAATLEAVNPRKTFLNFRNSLFNLLKNVPGKKVYGLIALRLLLDGLAGLKFICEGKPAHTKAILKAHGSFYRHFSLMRKKRKMLLPTYQEYYRCRLIVFDYFVGQKRTYRDLFK